MYSETGSTDYAVLFKVCLSPEIQVFLFVGIFIAIAVKTPLYFVNIWLLKAHVESPLSGSIILAAVVLKLSVYAIFRLLLPILPDASLEFAPIVYTLSAITVIYASLSTLRTIDIKELIAYSSVSHAGIYLMGAFSNTVNGIEGAIVLGLGHGFVSSGLFICVGGILYDRTHTRLITYYRGLAQVMPLFSLLFFILCLANSGTPLTVNFVGEFLSLYGAFERLPILGALACSSIVFSAAFTIFLYNRIAFGGSLSDYFKVNIPDLTKREFVILISLVVPTILFGIYPKPILDGLHYSVSTLIFNSDIQSLAFPAALSSVNFSRQHVSLIWTKNHRIVPILFPRTHSTLANRAKKLDPYFITGFTDAEGCFYIDFVKRKQMKLGWTIHGVFGIVLHKQDIALLELIQLYFNGMGNITKQGKDKVQYRVSSLSDLQKYIIPHFNSYPLITQKKVDFDLFKQIIEMQSRKEHLTIEGLRKIVSIKASSNLGLSEQHKIAFPNIIPIEKPKVELPEQINPQWLAGFVSGDGHFCVNVFKSSGHRLNYSVILNFSISQHSRDAELMKSLAKHFGCGIYYPRYNRNVGEFQVRTFSDILEYIIPFFEKYPIVGVKYLDYLDFCRIAKLMKESKHLTKDGLEEIRIIKAGMNTGRYS